MCLNLELRVFYLNPHRRHRPYYYMYLPAGQHRSHCIKNVIGIVYDSHIGILLWCIIDKIEPKHCIFNVKRHETSDIPHNTTTKHKSSSNYTTYYLVLVRNMTTVDTIEGYFIHFQ